MGVLIGHEVTTCTGMVGITYVQRWVRLANSQFLGKTARSSDARPPKNSALAVRTMATKITGRRRKGDVIHDAVERHLGRLALKTKQLVGLALRVGRLALGL